MTLAAEDRPTPSLVAIHQPNFFPWLGYFHKLSQVQTFVFMDNVQLPRSGKGSWVNRVRVMISGEPRWATMPIRRQDSLPTIAEVEIDNSVAWRGKLKRTIQQNYARGDHFEEVFPWLENLVDYPASQVVEYNAHAIRAIAQKLDLDDRRFVLGSTLAVSGKATDLLIDMVKAVGGTGYLAGAGAAGYQEDEKFPAAGLALRKQEFEHPIYRQVGSDVFAPGLSIVDVLLNQGFDWVRRFLAG